MKFERHDNLIAGVEHGEDAGVYRISDDLALVQTVDFFTPIVDDAYTFGQIAVANALSDVYAMGGRPITALNIVAFPVDILDISVLRETLRGGLDKMHQAGVLLVGGHSVTDPEMKYGLAVTGTVHPDRVVFNTGARPGDQLVLTKPLGTGIIATATKRGVASAEAITAATASMNRLNALAATAMTETGVHAATDITGFGLIGHAAEMLGGGGIGIRLETTSVPLLPETITLAGGGNLAGGLKRNRDYRARQVDFEMGVPGYLDDILHDPQTSGGLLIAVAEDKARTLLDKLHAAGVSEAAVIGEVLSAPVGRILVV